MDYSVLPLLPPARPAETTLEYGRHEDGKEEEEELLPVDPCGTLLVSARTTSASDSPLLTTGSHVSVWLKDLCSPVHHHQQRRRNHQDDNTSAAVLRSEKESVTSSSVGGEEAEHHGSMVSDEKDTLQSENALFEDPSILNTAPPVRPTAMRGGGSAPHSLGAAPPHNATTTMTGQPDPHH